MNIRLALLSTLTRDILSRRPRVVVHEGDAGAAGIAALIRRRAETSESK